MEGCIFKLMIEDLMDDYSSLWLVTHGYCVGWTSTLLCSISGCLLLPLSAEEVAKRLEKEETPPRLDER